jgi:hypothetical protein
LEVKWLVVVMVFLVQVKPELWFLVWLATDVVGFCMGLVLKRFTDSS